MLATPAALKPRLRVRGEEPSAIAAVKGDARMAQGHRRGGGRPRAPDAARRRRHPRRLPAAHASPRLRAHRRARTRARRGNHNERRPFIAGLVVDHFRRAYRHALVDAYRRDRARARRRRAVVAARTKSPTSRWPRHWRGGAGPRGLRAASSRRGSARARGARRARAHVADPQRRELVNDLFGFEALIRSASEVCSRREEQRACSASAIADVTKVDWTEADLALIDEADSLLGSVAAARARPPRPPARGVTRDGERAWSTTSESGAT